MDETSVKSDYVEPKGGARPSEHLPAISVNVLEGSPAAELLATLRQVLPVVAERYGVRSLGLFGSHIRNEQGPHSDLDLLVEYDQAPSLLKFIELEHYLTDLLGMKVDLVLKTSLKPMIRNRILREVIPL